MSRAGQLQRLTSELASCADNELGALGVRVAQFCDEPFGEHADEELCRC